MKENEWNRIVFRVYYMTTDGIMYGEGIELISTLSTGFYLV
jgi:hypothetical protein